MAASAAAADEVAVSGGEPAPPALRWQGLAIVDMLHADAPSFTGALGHLDVSLSGDAERLFGWRATTFRLEALADGGAKPNGRVATLQGISSIEVRQSAGRLYAAWLQRELAPATSLRVGLYDLNSEFYATDASSLLIHPAFGIGAELAQTGRNGPSIFPDLAFAARLAWQAPSGAYGQAALLSASAGDPEHPGRTTVRISRREGALAVAEAGWQAPPERRHGVGHWGMGVWSYSEPAPRLDGTGRAGDAGAYVLGQALWRDAARSRITLFGRAGVAAANVNPIDRAVDAGLLAQRSADDGGPRAWSVGVAYAHLGAPYRALAATRATSLRSAEVTVETGARWRLDPHLAVQPLLQYVVHPGGRPRARTTIVGVRWLVTLPGTND